MPTLYLRRQFFSNLLLVHHSPLSVSLYSLNSREGLRRAHSSSFDFFNLTLQQNGSDLQFIVKFY